MSPRLLPATAADAIAIADLHVESWRSAYKGLIPDAFLAGPVVENRRGLWRSRMATPTDGLFVLKAVDGDVVVGFTCVLRDADPEWGPLLDNLHVRPHLRGRGIGRTLLGASREWAAAAAPNRPMHLWVIEGNTQARHFYDREGGKVVERRTLELTDGIYTPALRYVWE